VNIGIAAFKTEYARRSALTVFERINEDGTKAKAAHFDRLSSLTAAHYRHKPEYSEGVSPDSRIDRCWWDDGRLWKGAGVVGMSRPTEVSALLNLNHANFYVMDWMRVFRDEWRAAWQVETTFRELARRQHRRIYRPVHAVAVAL
jgi:hypothetical protein